MSNHRAVFVTDRPPIHRRLALDAAPASLEVTMMVGPTDAEVARTVRDLEPSILISERSGTVNADILSASSELRLVQRLGSQVHDIDLDAARDLGVAVCTWPLPQCAMVAEHVLMQIMSLVKRARAASQVVVEASDRWGQPRRCDADTFAINWSGFGGIRQLRDSTVGIVGFGEIGTEVANLLAPFGCSVLYHRRKRLPEWAEIRLGVEHASRDDLLASSDIVCVLLPHSDETEGSVDAEFVQQMRAGSFLVSAGASTLLVEDAVAAAYVSGHLGGVATDGFRWEPVRADNPLALLGADPAANVVLTPHAAQADLVLDVNLRRQEYTNVAALLEGRPLQHRVA